MQSSACPVITAEQQAAIKPWAIAVVVAIALSALCMLGVLIYVVVNDPMNFRLLLIVVAGSELILTGITNYCEYRMNRIVAVPQRSTALMKSHRMKVALMIVTLTVCIVSYWW